MGKDHFSRERKTGERERDFAWKITFCPTYGCFVPIEKRENRDSRMTTSFQPSRRT
jgi:hypothetical protein